MAAVSISVDRADVAWKSLYRIGGLAGLLAAVVFRRNLGAEATLLSGQMPPETVAGWFTLLHDNRLLGLAFLNLFDIVNYALAGLLILALCVALRRASPSLITLAGVLGVVGVGVYLASNQALAVLTLSERYAVAEMSQQAVLLAAGEALLAMNTTGAAGMVISLLFVTLTGLLVSWVMLRSGLFSKVNAYLGVLAHTLVLSYFVVLIIAPALDFLPHVAAAVPLVIWYVLSGLKLWRLA